MALTEPYRKPIAICHYDPQYDAITEPAAVEAFWRGEMARLDAYLASLGLRVREATLEDIGPMKRLMAELFNAAAQKSAGEMYKVVRFGGYTIVLENAEGELVGFDLCTCYAGRQRLALGNMVGVSAKYAGKKLGLVLEQYSFLGNMAMGMRIRGGGVKPNNYNSMYMLFNQVGYVGEVYLAGQLGSLEPRILLAFPITPGGYMNNRVDLEKVVAFMQTHTEGTDWRTVACEDFDAVQHLYESTPFRVVAFLPQGPLSDANLLFALPQDMLHYPENM
jgi:hypothetical protein